MALQGGEAMPQQDEVYTITDDSILDSMRRELERRGAMRPESSTKAEERPRSGRSRVQYAQPPAQGRSAVLASSLSMFVCGAGQAYNGQGKLGALLFLTEALFISLNWAMTNVWHELKELADIFGITDLQLFLSAAVADYLLVILIMSTVYHAYREAEKSSGPFGGYDNPVVSGLASLVMPGWGQLVNGQPGKAVFFMFTFLSGAFAIALLMLASFLQLLDGVDAWRRLATELNTGVVIVFAAAGLVWILSVYDAMLVAGFRRRMS
jgi:TM2 domain-containing membrane protein YozV